MMHTGDAALDLARARYRLVAVAWPFAATLVGVVLTLLWLPRLPVPAATHWQLDGTADGSGPGFTFPLALALVGIGLTALLWAVVESGARRGVWGSAVRGLGSLTAGAVTAITVLLCWTVGVQVDAPDWQHIGNASWGMLAALVAGLVVAGLAWLLQPGVWLSPAAEGVEVAAPALAPAARATWSQVTQAPRALLLVLIAASGLALGLAIWLAVLGKPAAWGLVIVHAVLLFVLLATMRFRVRVDASGLTATAALGIVRFHVPIEDIVTIRVAEISPIRDFGGVGFRISGDRFGVVLRQGDAICVERRKHREFVVTVKDARRGAELLRAFADRRAGG